jgi:antitoxin CcdA
MAYAHMECAQAMVEAIMGAQLRKATNLSLDTELLCEARALGVNVSRAAEEGLRAAVRIARADAWKAENAEALASSNAWVEANGLPLAAFRQF